MSLRDLCGVGRPKILFGVVFLPGAGARHHLQRHGGADPAVCRARWQRPAGMSPVSPPLVSPPYPAEGQGRHGLNPAVPPQVCGVVFFSSDAAEQLLATHVIPPLDACTYMGLDSGAPPIQVTPRGDNGAPVGAVLAAGLYLGTSLLSPALPLLRHRAEHGAGGDGGGLCEGRQRRQCQERPLRAVGFSPRLPPQRG